PEWHLRRTRNRPSSASRDGGTCVHQRERHARRSQTSHRALSLSLLFFYAAIPDAGAPRNHHPSTRLRGSQFGRTARSSRRDLSRPRTVDTRKADEAAPRAESLSGGLVFLAPVEGVLVDPSRGAPR